MADDPAAVRERRIRGRLRHHHGHEQVRRAGGAADGIQEELDTSSTGKDRKVWHEEQTERVAGDVYYM